MKIYLHFVGGKSFPVGMVEQVLHEIEEILLNQERMELKRIRKEIPEIPKTAITEAISELETKTIRGQVVRISALKEGSLGVYLVMSAFGYWVLDKTLAKTLEEAWKESGLHEKLKAFFLKERISKLRNIQQEINQQIEKPTAAQSRTNFTLEVPMHAQLDPENEQLSVRVNCGSDVVLLDLIPTYNELVGSSDGSDEEEFNSPEN